jgi:alkylated DNA nucleotide flippase Atl1
MAGKYTAREKLHKDQQRRLVDIPKQMAKRIGSGKMLIPRPLDIDDMVRKVPKGKLTTIGRIRTRLAAKHGANLTCPLCTGIFLRLTAEASEEDQLAGRKKFTAYWRVVRDDGSLIDRFPDGVEGHAVRLEAEGHKVLPGKGKKLPKVDGLEDKLATL